MVLGFGLVWVFFIFETMVLLRWAGSRCSLSAPLKIIKKKVCRFEKTNLVTNVDN